MIPAGAQLVGSDEATRLITIHSQKSPCMARVALALLGASIITSLVFIFMYFN